ncbi:DnaB-like helicase N-terminal domain-containing protein, partial [Gemmatimonadota bacterium]
MTSALPVESSMNSGGSLPTRQAPWSPEAEQAVIGAMLLDADAVLKAVELLDDGAFYKEAHRRLFRAMVRLAERGDVVDPLTLRDDLERSGDLDAAGGTDYVAELIDAVPTAANVEYH